MIISLAAKTGQIKVNKEPHSYPTPFTQGVVEGEEPLTTTAAESSLRPPIRELFYQLNFVAFPEVQLVVVRCLEIVQGDQHLALLLEPKALRARAPHSSGEDGHGAQSHAFATVDLDSRDSRLGYLGCWNNVRARRLALAFIVLACAESSDGNAWQDVSCG